MYEGCGKKAEKYAPVSLVRPFMCVFLISKTQKYQLSEDLGQSDATNVQPLNFQAFGMILKISN